MHFVVAQLSFINVTETCVSETYARYRLDKNLVVSQNLLDVRTVSYNVQKYELELKTEFGIF